MARKTTGSSTTSSTTSRSKKTAASIQPAAVQVASEVPKNGKPSNLVLVDPPVNLPVNLEDEIRRRAYELYLQRKATAGNENVNGDENQDWLIAEREIRLRYGNQERRRA